MIGGDERPRAPEAPAKNARPYWKRPRAGWTSVDLVFDTEEIHAAILRDLREARRSIDFETYIFEEDAIGTRYVAELSAAVKRGVKVRLLLDGIGSWPLHYKTLQDLEATGVQVRMFRPFHRWVLNGLKWLFLLRFKRFVTELPWVNKRDHRKLCIIDRKAAWVGSANICERHLHWRETCVRVAGPEMPFIQAGFEVAWAMARKTFSTGDGRIQQLRLQLYRHPLALSSARVKNKVGFTKWLSSGRYRETLLAGARHRVWIVSPYFIPTARILRKIILASRRGIDVRIMVPKSSDWKVTDWVAKTYYRVMLESGVKIFEYEPAMLHAKTTYLDQIVVVGSSNYNHRSLLHDFELDVVIDHPERVADFERQWEIDLEKCRQVDIGVLKTLPVSVKVMGKALGLFRYLM